MWSDPIPATLAALLWLLLDLVIFVAVARGLGRSFFARLTTPLLFVGLVALLVRLPPMLWLPVGASYDIESFRMVGDAFLSGTDVYSAARGRHPYLPFQMINIAGALWAARHSAVPFVVWLKLPALLADVAIAMTLLHVFRRWRLAPDSAVVLALLFALNPISLLITSYHGQFDALPVLLLVLAWWAWEQQRAGRSAVALGVAVLSKTWPLVFWPMVLLRQPNWRDRLRYSAVMIAFPVGAVLLYVLAFDADPQPLLRRALTHTGVAGYWGISAVGSLLSTWSALAASLSEWLYSLRFGLLLVVTALAIWHTRRQPSVDALLTTLLAVFAVSVGMGIQWLVWLIPFGLLALEKRWSVWYALGVLPMVFAQLFGLHLVPFGVRWLGAETATMWIKLASLPGWLVVVVWLWLRLRQGRAEPVGESESV